MANLYGFENDVKTYSIQTGMTTKDQERQFENDVKTYSIQTEAAEIARKLKFENDVKTYSIQTGSRYFRWECSLRMM